eukprot:TRINITY_DN840_c1_g1_i1.p1 TRINITY_DN840_c1_g1~~TRINITY_DN840_c1_g1_i1.p1  ORF type:complete len:1108 (-),score=324.85 TRINITY_DN840_c1_g1_i1:114-3437(-)
MNGFAEQQQNALKLENEALKFENQELKKSLSSLKIKFSSLNGEHEALRQGRQDEYIERRLKSEERGLQERFMQDLDVQKIVFEQKAMKATEEARREAFEAKNEALQMQEQLSDQMEKLNAEFSDRVKQMQENFETELATAREQFEQKKQALDDGEEQRREDIRNEMRSMAERRLRADMLLKMRPIIDKEIRDSIRKELTEEMETEKKSLIEKNETSLEEHLELLEKQNHTQFEASVEKRVQQLIPRRIASDVESQVKEFKERLENESKQRLHDEVRKQMLQFTNKEKIKIKKMAKQDARSELNQKAAEWLKDKQSLEADRDRLRASLKRKAVNNQENLRSKLHSLDTVVKDLRLDLKNVNSENRELEDELKRIKSEKDNLEESLLFLRHRLEERDNDLKTARDLLDTSSSVSPEVTSHLHPKDKLEVWKSDQEQSKSLMSDFENMKIGSSLRPENSMNSIESSNTSTTKSMENPYTNSDNFNFISSTKQAQVPTPLPSKTKSSFDVSPIASAKPNGFGSFKTFNSPKKEKEEISSTSSISTTTTKTTVPTPATPLSKSLKELSRFSMEFEQKWGNFKSNSSLSRDKHNDNEVTSSSSLTNSSTSTSSIPPTSTTTSTASSSSLFSDFSTKFGSMGTGSLFNTDSIMEKARKVAATALDSDSGSSKQIEESKPKSLEPSSPIRMPSQYTAANIPTSPLNDKFDDIIPFPSPQVQVQMKSMKSNIERDGNHSSLLYYGNQRVYQDEENQLHDNEEDNGDFIDNRKQQHHQKQQHQQNSSHRNVEKEDFSSINTKKRVKFDLERNTEKELSEHTTHLSNKSTFDPSSSYNEQLNDYLNHYGNSNSTDDKSVTNKHNFDSDVAFTTGIPKPPAISRSEVIEIGTNNNHPSNPITSYKSIMEKTQSKNKQKSSILPPRSSTIKFGQLSEPKNLNKTEINAKLKHLRDDNDKQIRYKNFAKRFLADDPQNSQKKELIRTWEIMQKSFEGRISTLMRLRRLSKNSQNQEVGVLLDDAKIQTATLPHDLLRRIAVLESKRADLVSLKKKLNTTTGMARTGNMGRIPVLIKQTSQIIRESSEDIHASISRWENAQNQPLYFRDVRYIELVNVGSDV